MACALVRLCLVGFGFQRGALTPAVAPGVTPTGRSNSSERWCRRAGKEFKDDVARQYDGTCVLSVSARGQPPKTKQSPKQSRHWYARTGSPPGQREVRRLWRHLHLGPKLKPWCCRLVSRGVKGKKVSPTPLVPGCHGRLPAGGWRRSAAPPERSRRRCRDPTTTRPREVPNCFTSNAVGNPRGAATGSVATEAAAAAARSGSKECHWAGTWRPLRGACQARSGR